MAAKLHIHKPYVLKALSRPLDRPDGPGRHTIGEVFGQKQDSKRRKRSELSVAIDGDAIHLYDIPSSQAITSYLVSPQSFFTCSSYSLRWRPSTTGNTVRYTYGSTEDSLSLKKEIKLFKDVLAASGTTLATTATHMHNLSKPIIHLSATSSRASTSALDDSTLAGHDLIAVSADGTLMGLNGETLEKKWQSSPVVLTQELSVPSTEGFQIEFVQSALGTDVVDGMFGGRNDLFGVFREKVHRDGFNPDILVVVTSITGGPQQQRKRYIHILALATEREFQRSNSQNVISVFVAPLPAQTLATKYQLDVRSGTLQELSNEVLYTYTFNGGIPRLESNLRVSGMTSFLRLSKTSIVAATSTSLSIYNPVYRSLQTTTAINSEDTPEDSLTSWHNIACDLFIYLAGRDMVVGLRGMSLVAFQIEAPKSRSTKRRAEGLLVDAIRRGISRETFSENRGQHEPVSSKLIADTLPGSLSEAQQNELQQRMAEADKLLELNDLAGFEKLLAAVFKISVNGSQVKQNGALAGSNTGLNGAVSATTLTKWEWPSSRADYPQVDRRWIFYAISKVFSWDTSDSDATMPQLTCRLPESNVLNYLVDASHLSASNIKSAFKEEIREVDQVDSILGEELPQLLVQVDPTMELLLGYLSGTQLGPRELTSSIKALLRSLDLLEDPSKVQEPRPMAITDQGEDQVQEQEHEADVDEIAMELDRAEEELQVTEYYLGSDSSSDSSRRAQGLSVAFSKLALCPAIATVQSLRQLFKPEEIICLMNVLRMELIKDGWTTRYLDRAPADDEEGAAPDGSIQIIADLMCRCIDSVGLGGWMAFDAMLASTGDQQHDSVDFFGQFKAEISTALEGTLEAIRMQGTLDEAVNYAKKARSTAKASGKSAVTSMQVVPQALPLGLKTESRVPLEKVVLGEIVEQSQRDIGLFLSKKRKSYSINQITEEVLLGGSKPLEVATEEEEML
ncbi:hypothetical protein B0H67DRAFT_498143 [Lasiosphaeris hirsuta]|uniref:Uncharacterized protein n=1 Tax=Lasiosphaeris hirsuta TaxID=260670 RepID=A0AA39ZW02_9PEZI|nr:hypothetical protein B0H67DRAFT_498143 [Lasiosphaeris hirsuta]